jgi:hypothetical protein
MDSAMEGESDAVSTDRDNVDCPLFMEGLPRDFSTNPALAALASLIVDESTSTNIDSQKIANASPGKLKQKDTIPKKIRHDVKNFRSKGKFKSSKELLTSIATSDVQGRLPPRGENSSPSVGEASLFLKMWKL